MKIQTLPIMLIVLICLTVATSHAKENPSRFTNFEGCLPTSGNIKTISKDLVNAELVKYKFGRTGAKTNVIRASPPDFPPICLAARNECSRNPMSRQCYLRSQDCRIWRFIENIYIIGALPIVTRIPKGCPGPLCMPNRTDPRENLSSTRGYGDPTPEPNIPQGNIENLVFSEMVLGTLRLDTRSMPPRFKTLRKSGAQLNIVEGLLKDFEKATKFLEKERDMLKQKSKKK